MTEKNRKLHNQFNTEEASTSSGNPIFAGVSIFVDGFTVPSSQELRGYMLKYGGRFQNYFSRHRVTHIICTNLPHSKLKNLRAFSAGLPVVKPTWILDSVASNRLLTWAPYQIDQLSNNQQPKLSKFFTFRPTKNSEDALCQVESDIEDSFVSVGKSEGTDAIMIEERLASAGIKCDEEDPVGGSNDAAKDEEDVQGELESSCQEPSASVSSLGSYDHNVNEIPSSASNKPSKQCHSTLSDPNFVENYFKNSRLHFIGTWRNRYRKRFPTLSTGFDNEISNISASSVSGNSVVIHVDMDCFFVSVVIRSHPELLDKPVAVCHSNNSKGTAEISSANYPARSYGIKAGMFVRDAKALCPHLVIFPYNFEAYEEVADQFYSILHRHCNKVQVFYGLIFFKFINSQLVYL